MPNEKYPRKLIPLDYWPPPGIKHHVKTGERWESVAAIYGIDVKKLIYHNFKTTQTEEVNWYLRHIIGCKISTDGGRNLAFSSGLTPGYIVIPTTIVNMEPYDYTAPPPPESEIERLKPIAKSIPGLKGEKIRCLLAMAEMVGSPQDEQWWYYSSQPTLIYTNFQTTNETRKWMTESTGGQLPFDGDAGPRNGGPWRTYPFRKLKIDCMNGCSDAELKDKIETIHFDFWHSFHAVASPDQAGAAYGPLVEAFVKHVHALTLAPYSLYKCAGIGPKPFNWGG